MELTLVGRGPGWERAAEDEELGRTIWCVSTVFKELRSIGVHPARVYQLHERSVFEPWIKEEGSRVMLMKAHPEFPEALVLPADYLMRTFGARFGSSFAWMFALALMEGFTDISIHGIHLAHESEYGTQRDTFHWFVGVAQAKGIKVNIDEDSGVFIANQAYAYQGA